MSVKGHIPCSKALPGWDQIRHAYIAAAGVRLHIARAGDGPPVILLHGFPEHWRSWRHQIPALINAGFSVWVLDLRGYNLSDKPVEKSAYQMNCLREDLAAIVQATGAAKVTLVGHDWGGIIAWDFAARHPEMVEKLIILNAPHMNIFREKLFKSRQILRSWYVAFFQLPFIPEMVLSARNCYVIRRMFERSPEQKGAFAEDEIRHYIVALSKPRALRAALNYYRANFWSRRRERPLPLITAPTLVIWGERDLALGPELLEGLERFVPNLVIHRVPDSNHWVQNEKPDEVNGAILSFLGAG